MKSGKEANKATFQHGTIYCHSVDLSACVDYNGLCEI
jgi:hypothetical protein